jgi:hypothetical protein
MVKTSAFVATVFGVATLLAVPVLAGGGGGGNVAVRMKNVGVLPAGVSSVSGNATQQQLINAAKVVAANGIAQFKVNAGTFTAAAADPNDFQGVNKIRTFQTRTHKTIYLWAQQDATTATLVGAPAGVKF